MSAFRLIQQVVRLLQDSQVESIEVKRTWFSTTVRVAKAAGGPNPDGGQRLGGQPPGAATPRAPLVPGEAAVGREEPVRTEGDLTPAAARTTYVDIKSPMVGTFYRAPEPGAEPYVDSGTRVRSGQVVCIIEAMKIMNEIQAEVAGVIREVLVEDAQPVEFGQPLFRVDPHG